MNTPLCECGHDVEYHRSNGCAKLIATGSVCDCKEFNDVRISKLEGELAKAKRDSERLDAVERESWTIARWRRTEYKTGEEWTVAPKSRLLLGGWGILYSKSKIDELPTVREAIDAAMEAEI